MRTQKQPTWKVLNQPHPPWIRSQLLKLRLLEFHWHRPTPVQCVMPQTLMSSRRSFLDLTWNLKLSTHSSQLNRLRTFAIAFSSLHRTTTQARRSSIQCQSTKFLRSQPSLCKHFRQFSNYFSLKVFSRSQNKNWRREDRTNTSNHRHKAVVQWSKVTSEIERPEDSSEIRWPEEACKLQRPEDSEIRTLS